MDKLPCCKECQWSIYEMSVQLGYCNNVAICERAYASRNAEVEALKKELEATKLRYCSDCQRRPSDIPQMCMRCVELVGKPFWQWRGAREGRENG